MYTVYAVPVFPKWTSPPAYSDKVWLAGPPSLTCSIQLSLLPIKACKVSCSLHPKVSITGVAQVGNARWLVENSVWGVLSTTSVHLKGVAWGNVASVTNFTMGAKAGVPFLYTSPWDTSMQVRGGERSRTVATT